MDTRSKALVNRIIEDITARRLKPGDEVGAAWSTGDSRAFTADRPSYTEAHGATRMPAVSCSRAGRAFCNASAAVGYVQRVVRAA